MFRSVHVIFSAGGSELLLLISNRQVAMFSSVFFNPDEAKENVIVILIEPLFQGHLENT